MSLIEEALAAPAEGRRDLVEAACADDAALFEAVWRRVEARERMGAFLLEPLTPPRVEEAEEFRTGTVLNGRFEILRTVAHGGMATVYEARDRTLEKRVALKCARAGYQRRLPPEVRHASEITHPNICRVFEIHTAWHNGADLDFLTMEFIEGETLSQRISRGALPHAELRDVAEQICAGLAEAHRRGVVHGDLKANNVILTPGGPRGTRVVITDFGLARGFDTPEPQTPASAGTPDYMAPELWDGASPSIGSDIYALGILLFEMSRGWRPAGRNAAVAVRDSSRTALSTHRLDRAIAKCLEADPALRWARVEDLAAAIGPLHRKAPGRIVAAAALLALVALAGWWFGARSTSEPTATIAVLPFTVENPMPGDEHLGEGLAESLIHTLAQFPNLSVIARSSSFRYTNASASALPAIAETLGAPYLVTGRIRRSPDGLVLIAELGNAEDGTQLWGRQFPVTASTIGTVEDRIGREIAEQIGGRLGAPDSRSAGEASSRAYELVLRGQYQRRLYTPESRKNAIGYFEQALVLDPAYALAHAELANTYRLLAGGGIMDPAAAMPLAEASATRALAANPDLAEAHAALADILKDRWRFQDAEREYQRAIALKPSLADAHMGYGILLSITGRLQAATAEIRRVRELDPVGLPGALHAAAVYYNGRQYSAALQELERARALDPSAPSAWMWTGMVLAGSGRFDEAVQAYRRTFERGDRTPATESFFAYALARAGSREEARAILARLEAGTDFVPLTALAVGYTGLGEFDRALELLREAYRRPDPILQYLKVESHYDSLQGHPAYLELANSLGLP